MTGILAIGSGALLGVMAIGIMAAWGCWWMCRCNSLAKLMPAVVAVWMLACLLWGIKLGYYFGTSHAKSEQQQYRQIQPQQSQPLQQSPPNEKPSSGLLRLPSMQSWREVSRRTPVSKKHLWNYSAQNRVWLLDKSSACPSLPTLMSRHEWLPESHSMMDCSFYKRAMTPNVES